MTEKPIDILKKVRSIAIVGISKNVEKDSYVVMQFLLENGYDAVSYTHLRAHET